MLDNVLHYFCSAHLSDILSKYMDNVLHKEKSVSLWHKLNSGVKKSDIKKSDIKYPCSTCGCECIEVDSVTSPKFKEFSVGCDDCQLWFHYVCVGLSGKEPELKQGSSLPYFCLKCAEKQSEACKK